MKKFWDHKTAQHVKDGNYSFSLKIETPKKDNSKNNDKEVCLIYTGCYTESEMRNLTPVYEHEIDEVIQFLQELKAEYWNNKKCDSDI